MPTNVELLGELAERLNQRLPLPIERYFTEDFRLDDAGAGMMLTGHAGAKAIIDHILALAPDVHYQIRDTVAAADRVAVRWRVTGTTSIGSSMGASPKTGAFGVASPGRRADFQAISGALPAARTPDCAAT